MGLSYCSWVPWSFGGALLQLLVVPENKRQFIVFSFRPIDSVVFLNIKYVLFIYLLTHFLWMLVQWTTEMHLFHITKNNFWVKIHFKIFETIQGFITPLMIQQSLFFEKHVNPFHTRFWNLHRLCTGSTRFP